MKWLAVVLLVACSTRADDPAPAQPPDRAHADMLRQRARVLATSRTLDRQVALDAQITELAGKLGDVRGAVTLAKTAAERVAAQRHADDVSKQFDEALAGARALGEAALAESVRIDGLPDRCFVKPPPADCKLAPELLPDD